MRTSGLLALLLPVLALLLTACPTRSSDEPDEEFEGDEPGECSDGADNDRDGFYDCDDQDCWSSPDCTGDDDDSTGDDDDVQPDDDDAQPDDDDVQPDDDDVQPDDDDAAGAYIYAHTSDTLYEVEPDAPYAVTPIGTFTGLNMFSQGVTDIAVDLMGEMWGVGFFEIYEVNVANAACTERAFDMGFGEMNAMTFLADGTLLAGSQNRLYEVNTSNGSSNVIQTFSGYWFAGDMVGLPDGLLYMLMCVGAEPPCDTSLVVMDLDTMDYWEVGPTGAGAMYGVAYYNSNELIYGFNEAGQILLVDPTTGAATPVSETGIEWWGATTNPARWSG